MNIILVHGSVETSCDKEFMEALQNAALAGYGEREKGLLDVVEKTVALLEDSPLFNAGYGSVLNLDGEAEMDASIMDGATGRCGAVGGIQDVKNPVLVARKVMDETSHVILAGSGATRFARRMGFEQYNPVSQEQRDSWERAITMMQKGETLNFSAFTGLPKACDTVGCVAFDGEKTAAASSTGGSFLKLPGRIGDTPVIGGGIYASSHGAAVCTGRGEAFIQMTGASRALTLLEKGRSAKEAAIEIISLINQSSDAIGGILVVDAFGNAAAAHNSSQFPVALVVDGKIAADFEPIFVKRT